MPLRAVELPSEETGPRGLGPRGRSGRFGLRDDLREKAGDDDDDDAAVEDEIDDAEGVGTVKASADGSADRPAQSVGRAIIAAAAIAAVAAANLDAIVLFALPPFRFAL